MASRKSRTRAAPALSVPRTAAAGLTATVGMDLAALATARTLRMPPLGPNNLGRWVGHMREGRFAHDHIETAEPVPREAVVGAAAHYLIGPALGVGYGLTLRLTGRPGSSLRRGIAYGVVTTVFPWFLVYPAFGWGPMGLRGRGPKLAVSALVNHVAYGAGLGLVMTRLPPRPTGGAR